MAEPRRSRRWDISAKQVVVGLLALVLVIFALLNTQEVRVDFILDDRRIPLIIVIVGSALIGFLIGWFVKARANRND
jgi:lipopolysaccharide assembly protein A